MCNNWVADLNAIRRYLFVIVLLLSGCAPKLWTDPLENEEFEQASELLKTTIERQNACGSSLAADLTMSFSTAFRKSSVTGFFQFSRPANFRFVVVNPFGLPILAVAGNQNHYRSINTTARTYQQGSLNSFGLRNNIPAHFLEGNWYNWLTGSTYSDSQQQPPEIRYSADLTGIWVSYQNKEGVGFEHLLIDREKLAIVKRLIEDEDGEEQAEIVYAQWHAIGECRQPVDISIRGLNFNTTIQLQLSAIEFSEEKIDISIPVPYGFSKTYLP